MCNSITINNIIYVFHMHKGLLAYLGDWKKIWIQMILKLARKVFSYLLYTMIGKARDDVRTLPYPFYRNDVRLRCWREGGEKWETFLSVSRCWHCRIGAGKERDQSDRGLKQICRSSLSLNEREIDRAITM